MKKILFSTLLLSSLLHSQTYCIPGENFGNTFIGNIYTDGLTFLYPLAIANQLGLSHSRNYFDLTSSSQSLNITTQNNLNMGAQGAFGLDYSVWIDFNKDGTFASNERVITDQWMGAYNDNVINTTQNFTTPMLTSGVKYRMRILAAPYSPTHHPGLMDPCQPMDNTPIKGIVVDLNVTFSSLSINQINLNGLQIYPNPANDHITIDCGTLTNVVGYSIKITNTLGQEVFNQLMNTQQYYVPLNSWTGQGVYFVNIIDAQGHTIDVKKIILQ